jgi:hypothetical protein
MNDEPSFCDSVYGPILRIWWTHPGDLIGNSIDWYANLFVDPDFKESYRLDPAEIVATRQMILTFSP